MRPLAVFLIGAVFGGAVAAWVGPRLIHWYAQPPFTMGCDCGQAMNWAMGKLVIVESIGAALGAVVILLAAFFFGLRRGKAAAKPS